MLIILAIYYLTSQGVQALPILALEQPTAPSACYDLRHCRTIGNIIWSCLVTVSACTWIAIHPNIPSPHEKWFTTSSRRLKFMLMAMLAPELVIV
jgi:hypothetical protein